MLSSSIYCPSRELAKVYKPADFGFAILDFRLRNRHAGLSDNPKSKIQNRTALLPLRPDGGVPAAAGPNLKSIKSRPRWPALWNSDHYTRRRFGGRQPLCGMGVTSRMVVTLMPAD